jgi:ATP-binding cassette subfamily B protein/subfamily B ATP-binding cassette protein MsbA
MGNFGRALRLALRHRLLVVASLVCAVLVGVLWGGNIGAVYPFVDVIFQRRTMQDWVRSKIDEAEQTARPLRGEVAALERQLPTLKGDAREVVDDQLSVLQHRLAAEERAIGHYQFAQVYIDRYLPHDAFQTLVLIVGLLIVGTLLKSLFFIAQTVLVSVLVQRTTFELRNTFYRRTLRMDLAAFTDEGTSDLMCRFTQDIESLAAGMKALFGKAVREPLKMLVCFAGAAWISWQLLVLSLVVAPLAAFLIGWLAKTLKRANRKAMEEMSQLYGVLEETLQGIKIVKAFTMERSERARFHRASKKYNKKAVRIDRYDSLTRPLTEFMGIVTICLALMAGAYLVLEQKTHLFGIRMSDRPFDVGALVMFYGLLAGTSDPARKLSEIFSRIQRASAASDRIFAMIDREPMIQDPPAPRPFGRHSREIVFDQVTFAYRPGVPVIDDINLRVPFGETIAIVGPNGCGKSTLANLLPRFFDPVSGAVKIDGADLRHVRLRHLRQQIGLVTQEPHLFDDSVLNNIRYGAPHATRAQVIEAAKQAHAHRFIEDRLHDGYDSVVGPRGGQLSGGQRQRIALARAILRDPSILILDEATSQVDLESEQLIQNVLEGFVRNRTTFLITHRMATLALADRIVVMNSGRILDIGTHDELVRRCELYSRLYDIQLREIA